MRIPNMIKTETVKKARVFNLETGSLSELIFVPYDPKLNEIYTTRVDGQLIYQIKPDGSVTQ